MKRIHRTDRIRLDASTAVRHANGWLDVWGVATTAEVVYPYPEFKTNEFRPASEVMHPDSLASLLGAPLTLDHPADDVDSRNYRDLAHGSVFLVEPRDNLVYTRIRFATDAALDAIKAGTVELSCGYDADYDETPGTAPDGTPYTGVQRNIRYNHLALVDVARAGHVARIRLDSERRRHDSRSTAMKRIKIGNKTRDVASFVALALSTACKAAADEHAELRRTDAKRADEIATAEVTIDGVTMVLPKAMVDAILQSIGAGGAAPAEGTASDPPTDAAAVPPEDEQKPVDSVPGRTDARVDRRVDAALARERERATIERKAHPLLGDSYDYADGWGTAATVVGKINEGRKDSADAEAAKARKGDGVAQGKLLAWLDDALEQHRGRQDSSGSLALAIHEGRVDGGNRTTEPAKRTDKVADAGSALRARIFAGGKAPATTGATK